MQGAGLADYRSSCWHSCWLLPFLGSLCRPLRSPRPETRTCVLQWLRPWPRTSCRASVRCPGAFCDLPPADRKNPPPCPISVKDDLGPDMLAFTISSPRVRDRRVRWDEPAAA